MCGRFTLHTSPKKFAKMLSATLNYDFPIFYNIAPTQTIAAMIAVDHERIIVPFRWGLIPSWHKDDSDRSLPLLMNAKSETTLLRKLIVSKNIFTKNVVHKII